MSDSLLDLIVIGTGTAASTIASRCRAAGWTVAVVDFRPFGGTCALRGCDPKKVLVGAAETVDGPRRLRGNGVEAQALRIDWPGLMRFKRTFTDPVPSEREKSFARSGIRALHGTARFVDDSTIDVEGERLEARHIVIATGARPATLPIAGSEHLTTSDEFLKLPALPPRIVFAGGGYISFEFAHVTARAGAAVTILHRGERPLEVFDVDLVNALVDHSRSLGIDVRLNTEVAEIQPVQCTHPALCTMHCALFHHQRATSG